MRCSRTAEQFDIHRGKHLTSAQSLRRAANFIQVLDFGASRDGVALSERGRRIVVNNRGQEIDDIPDADMVDAADQPQ